MHPVLGLLVFTAVMTALFMGIGYLIGGATGMVVALVVAGAMNLFSYWNADKIVLKMYKAQVVDETHPNAVVRAYVADVKQMAMAAGLPQPVITIIPNDQPNAFATGRNPQNAAVAATSGLLDMLTREEVRGVMAHELAHVKNRDTLTMTVTATVAGAIAMLANFAFFFGGGDDRERPGGMIGAIDEGFPQKEISAAAYRFQQQLDRKEKVIVGVNKHADDDDHDLPILKIDQASEDGQVAFVKKTKTSGTLGRSAGISLAHLSELCSYDNDEGLVSFRRSLSDSNPNRL